MKSEDLPEFWVIHEIALHARFFVTAILKDGMEAAAKELGVDAKTITNHIKNLENFTGEPILRHSKPGETMKLTEHGELWAKALVDDYADGLKKLYLTKVDNVVDEKLLAMAKAMFLPPIPDECNSPETRETPVEKEKKG